MEWLIVLCLVISTLNLYFFFKKSMQKSFEQELTEFRTYTETLITEFNRITTRNVDLLDERIDELNHKIRLSQKIDLVLKERFEEAHKIEFLKPLKINEVYKDNQKQKDQENLEQIIDNPPKEQITTNTSLAQKIKKENNTNIEPIHKEINLEQNNTPSAEQKNDTSAVIPEIKPTEEPFLFEGQPIDKIKKHQNKTNTHKKQKLLLQYLSENKTKEELLNLGFNSNEINIAILCLSAENNEK